MNVLTYVYILVDLKERCRIGIQLEYGKKKSTLPLNCFVQNGRINIAHVIQSYHEIKTKVIMGKAICLMSLCNVLVCMQLFYFDVFDRLKVSIAYTIVSFESHKSFTLS